MFYFILFYFYLIYSVLETHPEYLEKVNTLLQERDELILQAELIRDYQMECARVLYEMETAAALEEYAVGSH